MPVVVGVPPSGTTFLRMTLDRFESVAGEWLDRLGYARAHAPL